MQSDLLKQMQSRYKKPVRAGYLGASNGEAPQFYEFFKAAAESAQLTEYRHVSCHRSEIDSHYLAGCQIVLLAGGDVLAGYNKFLAAGLLPVLREMYLNGGSLIGVSAGAIQLGSGYLEDNTYHAMLGFTPHVVSVHDEANNWAALRQTLRLRPSAEGMAIPFGGGLLIRGNRIESIGKQAVKFIPSGKAWQQVPIKPI